MTSPPDIGPLTELSAVKVAQITGRGVAYIRARMQTGEIHSWPKQRRERGIEHLVTTIGYVEQWQSERAMMVDGAVSQEEPTETMDELYRRLRKRWEANRIETPS